MKSKSGIFTRALGIMVLASIMVGCTAEGATRGPEFNGVCGQAMCWFVRADTETHADAEAIFELFKKDLQMCDLKSIVTISDYEGKNRGFGVKTAILPECW